MFNRRPQNGVAAKTFHHAAEFLQLRPAQSPILSAGVETVNPLTVQAFVSAAGGRFLRWFSTCSSPLRRRTGLHEKAPSEPAGLLGNAALLDAR
jgi:hypothetical protein